MNEYDHEDAFRAANRYAGGIIDLGSALKTVESELQARAMIADLQRQYEKLFNAYIAGVDYGRENPKP